MEQLNPLMTIAETKRCTKCGKLLPLIEFSLTRSGKALCSRCKACKRESSKISEQKWRERGRKAAQVSSQTPETPPAPNSTVADNAPQTPNPDALTPQGAVGTPENPVEPNGQQKQSVSEDGKKKLQDMIDATALVKAETAKILAEIARDEAVGKRDKPEVLTKKEAELKEFEAVLVKREAGIREKETNQANRDIVLNDKQVQAEKHRVEMDAYVQSRKKDADILGRQTIDKCEEYAKQVRSEADAYGVKVRAEVDEVVNAQKFEADNAKIDLENVQAQVRDISGKVVEAQKRLDEIAKQVKAYLPQVVNHATQHYNTAMRSSGKTADFHHSQANQGWDLEKELNKLLKWIGI